MALPWKSPNCLEKAYWKKVTKQREISAIQGVINLRKNVVLAIATILLIVSLVINIVNLEKINALTQKSDDMQHSMYQLDLQINYLSQDVQQIIEEGNKK